MGTEPDTGLSAIDHFSTGGDVVPGGYNGWIAALDGDDRKLGHVDWQIITEPHWDDGTALVAWIEVDEEYRRRGVATRLLERVVEELPDRRLAWGYTTEEGDLLRRAWESRSQSEHATAPASAMDGLDLEDVDLAADRVRDGGIARGL